MIYQRHVVPRLREALADTPVVLVVGPRQAGKSTLVSELLEESVPRSYVTLDDAVTLAAARSDPSGFLGGLRSRVCLDEIQRAPELLLPIKVAVDRDRAPGRFLLTGSANVLALPTIADSLAGRMEVLRLWPLAQCEIESAPKDSNLVDAMLAGTVARSAGRVKWAETKDQVVARALGGGFPPAIARPQPARRRAWFASYLTTMLDRDVRDLAKIEGLSSLPNLLGLIAARSGGLTNYADLASSLAISQPTVKRYVTLLERLFLVRQLPAWSKNLSVRLTKAPKIFLGDTGLAAHLLGIDSDRLAADPNLSGPLLETFAVLEILKLASWSERRPEGFHFRTSDAREVDLVLETTSGEMAAVEVKASATVSSSDFTGLRTLSGLAAGRLRCGNVLYAGMDVVPFEANLFAIPFARLWRPARAVRTRGPAERD